MSDGPEVLQFLEMSDFLENGFAVHQKLISGELLKKCEEFHDKAFAEVTDHKIELKALSYVLWYRDST